MTLKEVDEKISELQRIRRQLEEKEIKEFQEKAKLNVGRCFIVDNKYVMIIDIPRESWDRSGYCHFNRCQYPALYLGYDEEEIDPPIVPFYYDTIFSDILGEAKPVFPTNYREISKEEYLLEFDRLVHELRDIVKKAISPCCGNCYFFNGEKGDGIQFCDKKELAVREDDYCHKWMSK